MSDGSFTRFIRMFTLVFAGEMIFSLPFHTARFFRHTLLEVFDFSNTQLGDVFALYGITAMISYFPGGALADRYPARKVMAVSLFATALGGLYMATIPGGMGMAVLYGFWGISTILLFWAGMIRATREWGGRLSQGKAFGILDGGRGLVAAAVATLAVIILSVYLPVDVEAASAAERREGMQSVIWFYAAVTAMAGILVWCLLPDGEDAARRASDNMLARMLLVLRRPVVWAQAAVVVCAYCGFKGLDNYSLYAVQVLGMDEVEAANFTAYASYLRPVGAIAAGILADRFSASKVVGVAFLLAAFSYGILAFAAPSAALQALIIANILMSFVAVFALRGVYFALLEETHIPPHLTGTTVGLVSVVGFTPEIFFAPITGRILDAAPGLVGHQHYYLFLAGTAVLGLLVVIVLIGLNRGQPWQIRAGGAT